MKRGGQETLYYDPSSNVSFVSVEEPSTCTSENTMSDAESDCSSVDGEMCEFDCKMDEITIKVSQIAFYRNANSPFCSDNKAVNEIQTAAEFKTTPTRSSLKKRTTSPNSKSGSPNSKSGSPNSIIGSPTSKLGSNFHNYSTSTSSPKPKGVKFNRYVQVQSTYAKEDYNRKSEPMATLTVEDYLEFMEYRRIMRQNLPKGVACM
jgi:hypothetical protein